MHACGHKKKSSFPRLFFFLATFPGFVFIPPLRGFQAQLHECAQGSSTIFFAPSALFGSDFLHVHKKDKKGKKRSYTFLVEK